MGFLVEKRYITLEEKEYKNLLAVSERMSILRDYMNNAEYTIDDVIRAIIGIERKE